MKTHFSMIWLVWSDKGTSFWHAMLKLLKKCFDLWEQWANSNDSLQFLFLLG